MSEKLKALKWPLLIGAGVLLVLFAVFWQRCGIKGCPDVDRLKGYMPDKASTIVDHQGNEVGKLFLARGGTVALDSLPEHVPNAFIALEDKRFWDHKGVDWRRVVGAAWRNVKELGIEEGSSTITMQLARNIFPEKLPANKRTLLRKMSEARVARAIERKYTKREILELYLNQIYFGNGAYGIEAAAQEYFGKPASKLRLSEAALLAAVPRAPSRLNPRSNREAALAGRKLVLDRMVEQGMVEASTAEESGKVKLRLKRAHPRTSEPAPYFVEIVRSILEEQLGDAVYTDGLIIHTTLDVELQRAVEREIARQLYAIESGVYGRFRHVTYAMARADTTDDENDPKYLQTAAIFMDARSGDIRALVGGRNFEDSEFNRALYAYRQPGSAFKPFVYAAAFADGYTPSHQLIDQPLRLMLSRRKAWEPKNYDGRFAGVVSLRDALTYSRNVPTVRLATEIGTGRVVDMAHQMGLSGRIPAVPSVVLGTAELTPLDMTAAYAAFATLGSRPSPRFIIEVTDRDGNVVWSQPSEPARHVLEPDVAFMTVSLMQDVVNRGTGYAVRAAGYTEAAAGKTGTTNDAADIWFIGFTPELVGTIWMGFDKRQTVLARGTGGELAAPVWGRIMRSTGAHSTGWAMPPGVEMRLVDELGNVVGENCPILHATRQEYFITGTAPMATCYPAYDAYYAYDSMYGWPDTLAYDTLEEEGWLARMRQRILRDRSESRPVYPDTSRRWPRPQQMPLNPNPNARPPVDTAKPEPVPYDSLVKSDSTDTDADSVSASMR
jgi:penicillin-binding protein 1A